MEEIIRLNEALLMKFKAHKRMHLSKIISKPILLYDEIKSLTKMLAERD